MSVSVVLLPIFILSASKHALRELQSRHSWLANAGTFTVQLINVQTPSKEVNEIKLGYYCPKKKNCLRRKGYHCCHYSIFTASVQLTFICDNYRII